MADSTKARRRWTVIGSVTLGLVVIAAAALAYTGRPEFCHSCHLMETRYVSWERSVHAEEGAECLDCHAEPGAIGEIIAHLNGARYLWVKITGGPSTVILRGEVSEGTCVQCHSLDDLPNVVDGVEVAHRGHDELEIGCVECHSGFHDDLGGGTLSASTEDCDSCHRDPPVGVSFSASD